MAVTITDASLQGIYNRLHAIPEYHPLDAQTFADWAVEAGDVVTVSRENDSYSSPVHSSRMVWKGSPETQLTSGGNKQRDPVSTVSQKKYRRGSAAQRSQEIIQSTLEDEVGGVRSIVTQMANQWSVVVEGTGQNAHIKPAVIQASINAATQESRIYLAADKIELDGDAVADAIQSQNVQVQQLTVTGELIVDDLGSITAPAIECDFAEFSELYVGEESYNKLNIYDVSISGNTLTVWYVDGSHRDFRKAVSLDGRWNSAYNVRAGKTYTVTATMNGSSVGGEGVELADGDAVSSISSSVAGSWNGNVYTGKIAKLLDDGTYDATGLIYQVDVTNKLQEKTVTPTGSQQTVTPDNGYIGLSSVVVNAGGGGSGTITTVTGTEINEHQPAYSGNVKVYGTNISNSPYTVGIGVEHGTFQPQSGSARPCVNVKYGNTIIARQDVTVSATAPTFTYNSATHNYTASAQGKVWSTAYGTAATNTSGTEAYDAGSNDGYLEGVAAGQSSFNLAEYVYVNYDPEYSPEPKMYKITSGEGSGANCVMGFIIKTNKNDTQKKAHYNAPVTYAYRDGYQKGIEDGDWGDGYSSASGKVSLPKKIAGTVEKAEENISYPTGRTGGKNTVKLKVAKGTTGILVTLNGTLILRLKN